VVWAETPDGDVIAIHNSETEQFPLAALLIKIWTHT